MSTDLDRNYHLNLQSTFISLFSLLSHVRGVYIYKSEPFFPWQGFEGVVKDLKERDQREAHTETKQAAGVGDEVDDGSLLVPPDVGDHRLLDVDIDNCQVALGIEVDQSFHILDPGIRVIKSHVLRGPLHLMAHGKGSRGDRDVPDLPEQEAEAGVELGEHIVLSLTFAGSDQLLHQDTELLPLHEGLSVGEVRTRNTDGIDLK